MKRRTTHLLLLALVFLSLTAQTCCKRVEQIENRIEAYRVRLDAAGIEYLTVRDLVRGVLSGDLDRKLDEIEDDVAKYRDAMKSVVALWELFSGLCSTDDTVQELGRLTAPSGVAAMSDADALWNGRAFLTSLERSAARE